MQCLNSLLLEVMFYIGQTKRFFGLVILIIVLAAIGIRAAQGEVLNGASLIGICSPRFPCSEALRAFPRGVYNLGYLHHTFGDQCKCLERFKRLSGGQGYVRVHAVNGTCFPSRGRTCAQGEFFHGESVASASRKLVKRDPRFLNKYRKHLRQTESQVSTNYTGASRVSLCLECPLPNSARRVMLSVARRTLSHRGPNEFIDNPIGHACLNNTICEGHGVAPRFASSSCIADNDGSELTKDNLKGYLKQTKECETRFYWTKSFNLLPKETKEFILPRDRSYRTTRWEFRRLRRFLKYSSF